MSKLLSSYYYLCTDAGDRIKQVLQEEGLENKGKTGDGHVTLLYGYDPEKCTLITTTIRRFLFDHPGATKLTVSNVAVGFDKKSVVCEIDNPELERLFSALYGNPFFCRGNPLHSGPNRFDDSFFGKRHPHFTLWYSTEEESMEDVPEPLKKLVGTAFSVQGFACRAKYEDRIDVSDWDIHGLK